VDGDTVTVLDRGNRQTMLRLVGIDAPEKEQLFGDVARQRLSALLDNKNIIVVSLKVDSENRQIVGKVLLDNKDVALEILRTGNAWYFKEHENVMNRDDIVSYNSAESEARRMNGGLWQNESPEPPWKFRERVLRESLNQIPYSSSTIKGVKGKVTEILSGISFAMMRSDYSRTVICVSNLEVPEPGQPMSDIAQNHLRELLLNQIVLINIKGFTEDDSCLLADVYLNATNINLQMVRDGVAWSNKDYYYPEGYYIYAQAENAARNEKRGIWQNVSPMPPWIYREQLYNNGGNGISISGIGGNGITLGSSNSNAGKTVYVRGYTKRDGTYVRSYTRSAPNTKSTGGSRKN
jgi:endonuclease YncB( thermonuclease family)